MLLLFSPVYSSICYECERKYSYEHTHKRTLSHIYALTMVNVVCVLACSPHHSNSNNSNNSDTRCSGSLVKYLQNFVKGPALISSRARCPIVCPVAVPLSIHTLSSCPFAHCGWLIESNNSCSNSNNNKSNTNCYI